MGSGVIQDQEIPHSNVSVFVNALLELFPEKVSGSWEYKWERGSWKTPLGTLE